MNILANTIRLSIIIPFKNEKQSIPSMIAAHAILLNSQTELIYIDDGSTDGSYGELMQTNSKANIFQIEGVGTGKAFFLGAQKAKGKFILLLPADCVISRAGIDELLSQIESSKTKVFLFEKRYAQKKIMFLYAFLQNLILLKWVKLAAWTNGFVFHNNFLGILEKSVKYEFLNDLEFSRNLRFEKWTILTNKISVSARRYEEDGTWRRIFLNGLILILWKFKWASVQRLHSIYRRGKI